MLHVYMCIYCTSSSLTTQCAVNLMDRGVVFNMVDKYLEAFNNQEK